MRTYGAYIENLKANHMKEYSDLYGHLESIKSVLNCKSIEHIVSAI